MMVTIVRSFSETWTARALLSTCSAAGLSALSFRGRYSRNPLLSSGPALQRHGASTIQNLVSLACLPAIPDGRFRLRASCSTDREWVGFLSPRYRCVDSALGDGTWVSAHALKPEGGIRTLRAAYRLRWWGGIIPGKRLGMPCSFRFPSEPTA